jgi:hypothetical protein
MRYLRTQTINKRTIFDKRLYIGIDDSIVMNTASQLSLPSGTTIERPISPKLGMIRYNTTLNELEVYQGNTWRSIRYKESGNIIQQHVGTGNNDNIWFGPLNPAPPVSIQNNSTWSGANLLVFVENVFQLFNTNYTIVQNPTLPTDIYTAVTSAPVANSKRIYFNTSLYGRSVSITGSVVTINFESQPEVPFTVGSEVLLENFVPNSYNGTHTLVDVTLSSITFNANNVTPCQYTGSISSIQTMYPSINLNGTFITGANIPANSIVVDYGTDPHTNALTFIELNNTLVDVPANTTITITKPETSLSGYFLQFGTPIPNGKAVTVLHGFDS